MRLEIVFFYVLVFGILLTRYGLIECVLYRVKLNLFSLVFVFMVCDWAGFPN